MDCETFERLVLDRVFLELDELTTGAAQRHVSHCSRCRSIEVGLRATRDVCRLPQVAPMDGFAEGVVAAERQIHSILPLRQRANRALSVLAAYTMRPQPTMAALLLLMIGASLFLVRARPAERDLVQVTERGVPEGDLEQSENKGSNFAGTYAASNTAAQQHSEPTSASSTAAQSISTSTVSNGNKCAPRCKSESNCEVDSGTAGEQATNNPCDDTNAFIQPETPSAMRELDAARAIRKASGCAAAIQPLELIRQKYPSSEVGQSATWDAAECYFKTNRKQLARTLLESLTGSPRYARRARLQLDALGSQ